MKDFYCENEFFVNLINDSDSEIVSQHTSLVWPEAISNMVLVKKHYPYSPCHKPLHNL